MSISAKKAVVVGGSNGIGLAVSKNLINKGYHTVILDLCEPDKETLAKGSYTYYNCNLLDFDQNVVGLLEDLSRDESVSMLMITAGMGRVADFEYLHISEINNLFTVDAVSAIKIIRIFYDRIKSKESFYCGIMGSIAGLISSPMFSVYAAAKSAVCRFTESVNIELEASKTENRILNVSPGSIKGTKFNGGENDLSLTGELAEQIVSRLLNRETLFIPQHDEIFKSVIERYKDDAHKFGLESYEYKKSSGRVKNEKKAVIGYLSGTFDLFHVGHLNLLRKAKQQCDYLIVGVHPNASHKNKETFIPFEERMAIVGACKYVDKVVESCTEDSDSWELWHYDRLFVGSDYKGTERFKRYEEFFKDKGVEIVYFPYTKGTSSTQIRKTVLLKTDDIPDAK